MGESNVLPAPCINGGQTGTVHPEARKEVARAPLQERREGPDAHRPLKNHDLPEVSFKPVLAFHPLGLSFNSVPDFPCSSHLLEQLIGRRQHGVPERAEGRGVGKVGLAEFINAHACMERDRDGIDAVGRRTLSSDKRRAKEPAGFPVTDHFHPNGGLPRMGMRPAARLNDHLGGIEP